VDLPAIKLQDSLAGERAVKKLNTMPVEGTGDDNIAVKHAYAVAHWTSSPCAQPRLAVQSHRVAESWRANSHTWEFLGVSSDFDIATQGDRAARWQ